MHRLALDDEHDCLERRFQPVDLFEQTAVLDRRSKVRTCLALHDQPIRHHVVARRELLGLQLDAGRGERLRNPRSDLAVIEDHRRDYRCG